MPRTLVILSLLTLAGCEARDRQGATGDSGATGSSSASAATAPRTIPEFQGQYRFLSNFYPAEVHFEGLTYPTVEHAYQSAKTLDMNERRRIAALPTPAQAKAAGHSLTPRPDWE